MTNSKQWVEEVRPLVLSIVKTRKRAFNWIDIDDLVQAAYLTLWESRKGFDPGKGAWASWAWQVVHRTTGKELRQEGKRSMYLEGRWAGLVEDFDLPSQYDLDETLRHQRAVELVREEVRQLAGELGEGMRSVLLEEYSIREAASKHALPEWQMRLHSRRATYRLKKSGAMKQAMQELR